VSLKHLRQSDTTIEHHTTYTLYWCLYSDSCWISPMQS